MEPPKSVLVSIVLALLTISVTFNVLSARRISELRKIIARAESQHMLQPGTTVPEIVGLDSHGSAATLHYGEVNVPTVLYVFTPQCGWCKKNLPNLHALIDQAGTRYRVLGIALTRQDLDSYLKNENLNLPIYSDVRSDVRAVYQLGVTPETIVVSPKGKVLKVWSGAYEEWIKKDIEKFLQIDLPGCCQETVTSAQACVR